MSEPKPMTENSLADLERAMRAGNLTESLAIAADILPTMIAEYSGIRAVMLPGQRPLTDEQVAAMSYAEAEAELRNAVYAATALIQRLVDAGRVKGDVYHIRKLITWHATVALVDRWVG